MLHRGRALITHDWRESLNDLNKLLCIRQYQRVPTACVCRLTYYYVNTHGEHTKPERLHWAHIYLRWRYALNITAVNVKYALLVLYLINYEI